MNKIQLTYALIFLCTFIVNTSLIAQFDGGFGDGAEKSSIIQITLNGSQINTIALYRGGYGDGHDKVTTSTTLAGNEISVLYLGSNGDGFDKDFFQGVLTGEVISQLYEGGDGDGFEKDLFSGVLTGEVISQLYEGGEGDGFDKDLFAGVLTGELISQLYEGGEGDGFDKDLFAGILTGEEISQLYEGGEGDGFDKIIFSGVLDGAPLSVLYSGGSGDGFSKHTIQYIFDFPECTFVVNTDDNGFGSLRYAIDCASPGDTIDFSPLLMQDSIVLTSGKVDIVKDLYINGIKSAELTVDASLASRAFKLGANTITIKGLKIIVGTDPIGGAVLNNAMLTLMDIDIYDPTNNATTVIESTVTGSLRIKGEVSIQEN